MSEVTPLSLKAERCPNQSPVSFGRSKIGPEYDGRVGASGFASAVESRSGTGLAAAPDDSAPGAVVGTEGVSLRGSAGGSARAVDLTAATAKSTTIIVLLYRVKSEDSRILRSLRPELCGRMQSVTGITTSAHDS